MTQRERWLGMLFGGTVAGLALWWGVNHMIVTPFKNVQAGIRSARNVGIELENKLREYAKVSENWQVRTHKTLAVDPKDAQLRFTENTNLLLERHGLLNGPSGRETKVTPGSLVHDKNGFWTVPITVQASGTLKAIVGYLIDFYRQDYLSRIDRIDMQVDQGAITAFEKSKPGAAPKRGKGGPANGPAGPAIGPDGPPINVTIYASTVTLPSVARIKPTPIEQIEELENGRLRYPVSTYAEIVQDNLFAPYQPPPPPPPPPATQQAQIAATQPEPQKTIVPVVVTPPRDAPEQHLLLGTTVLNGEALAYVKDERHPGDELTKYHLDDPIDDGTLLMIHQRGIVVRAKQPDGRKVDYFYPIRVPNPASFADREELTPVNHPEVYEALERAFVQDPRTDDADGS